MFETFLGHWARILGWEKDKTAKIKNESDLATALDEVEPINAKTDDPDDGVDDDENVPKVSVEETPKAETTDPKVETAQVETTKTEEVITLASLMKANSDLQVQLSTLMSEMAGLKSKITELQGANEVLTNHNIELANQLNALKGKGTTRTNAGLPAAQSSATEKQSGKVEWKF